MTYKESDGVPFVAKVQPYKMTFRDFRHHFGISSKANKRYVTLQHEALNTKRVQVPVQK